MLKPKNLSKHSKMQKSWSSKYYSNTLLLEYKIGGNFYGFHFYELKVVPAHNGNLKQTRYCSATNL